MKCIEDAADIGVVTAGGKIVVEFLDKTIYNERSQRCRMAPPVFEEREDRLLKKGKIKIIALIGAFVLTVLIVGLINRHSSNDTTDNMAGATLPVVTLTYADEEINELHGHTAQMNAVYMRDSITPLDKSRKLPVSIETFGNSIDKISYEIRSMDRKRLVAEADVKNFKAEDKQVTANIKIQNIIEEGEEYLLILKLQQGKKEVYYYTRIIQPVDAYVQESLAFAKDFHDTSMNPETKGTLATYLEPNSSGDNSSLNNVTIHSSLKQVTWADFPYQKVSEPIPSIKEISSTCNVITLDYVVKAKDSDSEYYNVEEYYRIRYTSARPYLLSYERSMNRVFSGGKDSIYDNYIQLGIRSKDVNYISNENGSVAAFVQEGDLWMYNQDTNQIAKVFSFRSDMEEVDDRENYGEHDIRIVSIDERGSMDFLVYGYMNRGIHEGRTGISVCHYDSVTNTVEEQLFLPVTTSYQVMKEDLGELAYQNNQEQFYLIAGKTLYQIDLDSLKVTKKRKDLKAGTYQVSASGRYLAYKDSEGQLLVEDLETGNTHPVKSSGGEETRAIGFIGEDFIYGQARNADSVKDAAGNQVFPMYQIRILSPEEDYKVVKTYEKGGYYITDVRIDENTIYLSRVRPEGGAYVDASEDTIVNSEEESGVKAELHTTSTKERQTQVQIQLAKAAEEEKKLQTLVSKEIIHERSKEVQLDISGEQQYYAYAAGKVVLGTANAAEAVRAADEKMGVVVGTKQQYIWKRSRRASRETVIADGTQAQGNSTAAKCLNVILKKEGLNLDAGALLENGETVKQILQEALKESTVLDLSGCGVEQVLYYVSEGNPVFAVRGTGDAVLITGYDSNSVCIYEPGSGAIQRKNMEEAKNTLEGSGSCFYAYLK